MKQKLILLAQKNDIELEVYENKTNRTDINITNGILKLFQINNVSTYTIKAIKNDRCIKLNSDSIKNPQRIINNINTIFAIQDNENKNVLAKGKIIDKEFQKETIDYNQVKENLFDLENLKKVFPQIINIEIAYSHYDLGYNLENLNAKMKSNTYYNEYGAGITVCENNVNRVLYLSYYSKDYNYLEFKNYLIEKIKNLIIKIDSDSCKTDKYKIILQNNAVADILASFTSSFDAKNIFLKESVLQDKYNTKVFSNKITIIENPNNDDAIVKRAFDSEGTKTCYKEIISQGKFVKKINNVEYALKLNEEPTGNSYGVNNLYIKPGNKTYNELFQSLENGIVIDEVFGLHSGIDEKTGNISLQAEGFLIKDGKITKGLNMIILSTNLFELFSNVLEVGRDLSKSMPNISAPSLLIENITITGKK